MTKLWPLGHLISCHVSGAGYPFSPHAIILLHRIGHRLCPSLDCDPLARLAQQSQSLSRVRVHLWTKGSSGSTPRLFILIQRIFFNFLFSLIRKEANSATKQPMRLYRYHYVQEPPLSERGSPYPMPCSGTQHVLPKQPSRHHLYTGVVDYAPSDTNFDFLMGHVESIPISGSAEIVLAPDRENPPSGNHTAK